MDLNMMPEEMSTMTGELSILQEEINVMPNELTDESSKPHVGMEFDSVEESKIFWNKYAFQNGFGDRIRSTHKDNKGVVLHRLYVCSREGQKVFDKRRVNSRKRANTRCDCGVMMKVSLDRETGKYQVKSFMGDHNHELEGQQTTHFIRAHRNINDMHARAIDLATGAGLGPKTTHRLMSLEAGGSINVGYTKEEIKSYLRISRSKGMELGEANSILEYMEEKSNISPNVFHNMQLDCDGKITNIYWADAKMIVDYEVFGDVIMFDTTFGTNKESRPLGVFTGFNNHRETVVFGASLLYDETNESFAWLFRTFIKCHRGKQPVIIFTDQDAAMKNALEKVIPEVRHCLCSWHIIQNATKNLAGKLNVNPPHMQVNAFISDLNVCMYQNCQVEEFEGMWDNLVEKYGLVGNKWVDTLYEKKRQWSVAYRMNLFSAGIRSTQLSESTNARLKKEMGGRLTMGKFFQRFDMFLEDVRTKEAKSDVHSRQSTPHLIFQFSPILKQAAQAYTPAIYNLFCKEFEKMLSIHLNENNEILGPHVRIAHDNGREYLINFDPSLMMISCSCCMFERHGYLCSHILRVFNLCRVDKIPERYILQRWTKHARSGVVRVECATNPVTMAHTVQALSSKFMRIVYQAAHNPEFVERIENFMCGEQKMYDAYERGVDALNVQSNASKEPIGVGVSGLKKKHNPKGNRKKRLLACFEKKGAQASKKLRAIVQSSSQATESRSNDGDDDYLSLSLTSLN